MQITVKIEFRDRGEAARWLAAYHSRRYELTPALNAEMNAEFPFTPPSFQEVTSPAIERAALRLLTEHREPGYLEKGSGT